MLQASAVRSVGRFLEEPLDVPWPVVEYLAGQLGILNASCVKRYTDRQITAYEHAWQIREASGLRVFEDAEAPRSCTSSWMAGPGRMPRVGALFDHGVGLRRNRVLLPGITVRLVVTVRGGRRRTDAHHARGGGHCGGPDATVVRHGAELAQANALSFYDASWAAAAIALGVPLVSADRRLIAAGVAESATDVAERLKLAP